MRNDNVGPTHTACKYKKDNLASKDEGLQLGESSSLLELDWFAFVLEAVATSFLNARFSLRCQVCGVNTLYKGLHPNRGMSCFSTISIRVRVASFGQFSCKSVSFETPSRPYQWPSLLLESVRSSFFNLLCCCGSEQRL